MSDQLVRMPIMDNWGFLLREDTRVLDMEDRIYHLTQENKRLETLLNTRSQFIRLVTHELKSPVAAVENYLKLILQGYIDLDDQDEILEKCIIRTCEERQLIDDLLDLGKLDDIQGLPAAPVRLDQVLDRVLSECRDDVDEKDIHLTLSVGNDIPAIRAVPELMRSIWCNLISNSLKYTPFGGEVTIGLKLQNQTLIGWVMDDGIGISSEDQEKIFQEFFRGENAKNTSVTGTGLGLVLVKKIVEGLGGKITFESELNVGSTFRFMIPVRNRT